MAFQTGPITLKGTIGGITFYKSIYGNLARAKGGPTRKQFKNDPGFARSRENSDEFKHCCLLTKKCWAHLRAFDRDNKRLYGRLMKLLCAIQKNDGISARGQRTVYEGLKTKEGEAMLSQFVLQENKKINAVLLKELRIVLEKEKQEAEKLVKQQQAQKVATKIQRSKLTSKKKKTLRPAAFKKKQRPVRKSVSVRMRKRKEKAGG